MHNDPCYSNEYGSIWMTVSWTVGASGAVGALAPATRAKGFAKTTPAIRNSAGNYTVTMLDKSYDLLNYVITLNGAGALTAGTFAKVTTDTLGSSSAPSVTFVMVPANSATATDPAQNDQIYVSFLVKRRSPL